MTESWSTRRLWACVLLKAAAVAILLVFLWAMRNQDAVVVYMKF